MPYGTFQPPAQSLFGNAGGPLEMLQRMLSGVGGAQQPAAPQPQVNPAAALQSELDTQMRQDPVAQQNVGNPDYEDMLKAELIKELEASNGNTGQAIQKALAAAGAAISGGEDVWSGISTGVTAYHGAREPDTAGRIKTLKGLVDIEQADADAPYEAEERAAKLDSIRAQTEYRRARAQAATDVDTLGPLNDQLDAQNKIATLLTKEYERLGLDEQSYDDAAYDAKMQEFEEYRAGIEQRYSEITGGAPAAPVAPGAPAAPQAQAAPQTGGQQVQPGEVYHNPETGERIYWNGTEWVPM